MIISLISALTTNHVIGICNTIPWYIPMDIKWFIYHTINKPILMGRKTFESIGRRPLKNRLNIVLSRFLLTFKGVIVVNSIDQALFMIRDFYEVMIIGGEEVYNIFLPQSKRLYLTYINTTYVCGDTWFPAYDSDEWKIVFHKFYSINQKKPYYSFSFNILERL